jgi:IS605 OrfB family transposase
LVNNFLIYIINKIKSFILKTIKLPYKVEEDLEQIIRQYSIVVRWSYNRFLEGKLEKDIRLLSKELNNIELLNSWLVQCAIKDGQGIQKSFKNEKVVFGGKNNFIKRCKNLITKKEYIEKRSSPINIQGEMLQKGNRSFSLDIIENNQIIFKLNKNKHIKLELPKLRSNIKKEIFKLQQLNEIKQGETGYTYSVRFDLKNIYISFEEFKNEEVISLNKNRCLGIDLNPDSIGISVLEGNKVIYVQEFSLKMIFDKILSEKLSSKSERMKYFQNKLKFETFEISKSIVYIAKKFNCKTVFIEDLNFKGSSTIKISNRKNKNLWKRELFINNLRKRLNIEQIKLFEVNPAYSSFIGNMMYNYTDPINASIEIARRGFEYKIKKNKNGFYPSFDVKQQWKKMATSFNDWKEFYLDIKNLKLKYRVSLNEVKHLFKVFKQNSSSKSMILNYVFYN